MPAEHGGISARVLSASGIKRGKAYEGNITDTTRKRMGVHEMVRGIYAKSDC